MREGASMKVREKYARAATVGAVLVVTGALTAPSQAFAGYTTGPYAGNSARDLDEALSFEVKRVKGKKGKTKIKVRNFEMETVVLDCTLTPWPGQGGQPERYFEVQHVPLGPLFDGKNV